VRLALISDVHTNVVAWLAVKADLQRLRATEIWCLGDWLGHGANHAMPTDLWHSLQPGDGLPPIRGVRGNNDIAVLDGPDGLRLNLDALQAVCEQRELLAALAGSLRAAWEDGFAPWLRSRPLILSPRAGVYMAHGTFDRRGARTMTETYVPETMPHEEAYREAQQLAAAALPPDVARACEGWAQPVMLLSGHSHAQGVWQRPAGGGDDFWPHVTGTPPMHVAGCEAPAHAVVESAFEVAIPNERPVWINPGSVGLPRLLPQPAAGLRWAQYALLDWDGPGSARVVIHLRRIAYPV